MALGQTVAAKEAAGTERPATNAPSRISQWTIAALVLLLLIMAVIAQFSPPALIGFKDTTTLLAAIAATSVGIERVLEGFWTVISLSYGSWWPPVALSKGLQTAMTELDAAVGPASQQADTLLHSLEQAGKLTADQVSAAQKQLETLRNGVNNLKGLAPNNPQAQTIVTSISQSIDQLQQLSPQVGATINLANRSFAVLADFADTFKNNPARQLISLYVGVLLGLIVSTVFGLDLLQAAGTPTSGLFPHLGIAVTGLVMGLGSNPTHEIIRAIQEYKDNLKSKN